MHGIDQVDKELLNLVLNDFPLNKRPWRRLGEKLNLEEDEVLSRIKRLFELGVIRKIGPALNGKRVGFAASTLVALRVEEDRIQKVSKIVNEYPNVTHNYQREHEFNIWFTISAFNDEELSKILQEIRTKVEVKDRDILNLPTRRHFKIDTRFMLK